LLLFTLSLIAVAPMATHANAQRAPRAKPVGRRIDSTHRLGVVFAVDQSGSTVRTRILTMEHKNIAQALADAVYSSTEQLMAFATTGLDEATGIPVFKDYFRIGGVGYDHNVRSLFGNHKMHSVAELSDLAQFDHEGRPSWVEAARGSGHTYMGEGLFAAH